MTRMTSMNKAKMFPCVKGCLFFIGCGNVRFREISPNCDTCRSSSWCWPLDWLFQYPRESEAQYVTW